MSQCVVTVSQCLAQSHPSVTRRVMIEGGFEDRPPSHVLAMCTGAAHPMRLPAQNSFSWKTHARFGAHQACRSPLTKFRRLSQIFFLAHSFPPPALSQSTFATRLPPSNPDAGMHQSHQKNCPALVLWSPRGAASLILSSRTENVDSKLQPRNTSSERHIMEGRA